MGKILTKCGIRLSFPRRRESKEKVFCQGPRQRAADEKYTLPNPPSQFARTSLEAGSRKGWFWDYINLQYDHHQFVIIPCPTQDELPFIRVPLIPLP